VGSGATGLIRGPDHRRPTIPRLVAEFVMNAGPFRDVRAGRVERVTVPPR